MSDTYVDKSMPYDVRDLSKKYDMIYNIGLSAGFVAPKPITIISGNTLRIERILDIQSIRSLYLGFMRGKVSRQETMDIMSRAGMALASIHQKLSLNRPSRWSASTHFISYLKQYGYTGTDLTKLPKAQLHGDFGFANVFWRRTDHAIVVLDPCADQYSTQEDILEGPIYLDLGKLLLSLEGTVPLNEQVQLSMRCITELQESVLHGYSAVGGFLPDPECAFAFSYALWQAYCRFKYRNMHGFATSLMYNRYVKRNFPLDRKLRSLRAA